MTFYKNNAYPDVDLHDALFYIKTNDGKIQFIFPKGFYFSNNGNYECCSIGMLQISNCSIDELSIYSRTFYNFLGIHCEKSRILSAKKLNNIFKKGALLQLFGEYYSTNEFIWRCAIFPYKDHKHLSKKYGTIEISAYHDSPLEYYIEKQVKTDEHNR